jgi:hypothetical protein
MIKDLLIIFNGLRNKMDQNYQISYLQIWPHGHQLQLSEKNMSVEGHKLAPLH